MLTFPFGEGGNQYHEADVMAAYEYSQFAKTILERINGDGNLNRLFAIEIGAEQEALKRWTDHDPLNPQYTWFGSYYEGTKWADLHMAVKNTLDTYGFQNVPIIGGGSVEKHTYLNDQYNTNYWTSGSDTRRIGSSKDFLRGFIERIYTYYGYNKLPNMIGIHGFVGQFNPELNEDFSNPNHPETYMNVRLSELIDICHNATGGMYTPDFCVTDYCFAGGNYNGTQAYSPDGGASEYTQGVYFLRAQLIFATSVGYNNGSWVGWKACTYYVHTFSPNFDCGFFNYVAPPGTQSSSRIIRTISQKLHDSVAVDSLGLNSSSMLWIPMTFSVIAAENFAQCGWTRNDGKKISAVWRFSESDEFYDVAVHPRVVNVPEYYTQNQITAKRFNFTTGTWEIPNYYNITHPNGIDTQLFVEVDENPVFIIFG